MTPAPVALLGALDGAAVATADALACNRWLSDLKKVQGWVDSFRAQVTARLDALAAEGESFGSEAAHGRCSGMSQRDAAKEKERARALGAAAGFDEALSQGRHVAAMVKQGEAAGVPEFVNRTVNRGRLAADALGELIAAGHGTVRPTVADITVLVDEQTLTTGEYHDHSVCETGDGAPLPIATVRRLICNAFVTGVVIGQDGTPLDVGRTTRTANRQQRRALRAMHRTCAAEGCDTLFDQCEIHHIWYWEHGGPSDLDNFLPRCAPGITTSCTHSGGGCSSHPTARSLSSTGTACGSWSPPPTYRTHREPVHDEPGQPRLATRITNGNPSNSQPCSPADPARPGRQHPDL